MVTDYQEKIELRETTMKGEDEYRTIFENVSDVIIRINKHGKVIDVNKRAEDIFGYTLEEMKGKHFTRLGVIRPKDLPKMITLFTKAIRGNPLPFMEMESKRKDGSTVIIEVRTTLVKINGKIEGTLAIVRDITEQKLMEKELRESEEFSASLLSNSPNPIHVINPDLSIKYVNPALEKLTGFAAEELTNKKAPYPWWPADMRDEILRVFPEVIKKGTIKLERLFQKKNGELFWVEITAVAVQTDGVLKYYLANWVDITGRKLIIQALSESETKFKNLAEESPNMIFINQMGPIVYANRRCEEIMGYKREEFYSRDFDFLTLIAPEFRELLRASFRKHISGKENELLEYTLVGKEGKRIEVVLATKLITYEGGPAILGVVTDVTPLKQVEALNKAVLNNSSIGVYIVQNGKFKLTNPAFQKFGGYTQDELLGKGSLSVVLPEDQSAVRENAINMLKGKRPSPYEHRYIHKNGEVRWAVEQIAPIQYEGKHAVLGSFMDITELKNAEVALRESEKKLNEAQGIGKIGNWEYDVNSQKLYWSGELFFLYERNPTLGPPTEEEEAKYYSVEQAKILHDYAVRSINNGEEFRYDIKPLLPSGRSAFFEGSMKPIVDEKGQVIKLVGTVQDITERKQNEQQLRLNESRLNSLVNILQHKTETIQEFLDNALEEAIKITDSKIGYLYFYDDVKKEFNLNSWSKSMMQECTIQEPQTIYQLDETGIWGEAVKQARPIIVNDFQADHSLKKGYPQGHAVLYKYLTIPVFHEGKIVAVVGVANKGSDYINTDVLQLQLLMESVWKEVENKRSEENILRSKILLQTVIDSSPDRIAAKDDNHRYMLVNKSLADAASCKPQEMIGKADIEFFSRDQIYGNPEKGTRSIREDDDIALKGGTAHHTSRIGNMDDGTLQVFDAFRLPLRDAEGKIYGVLAYTRDITETYKAAEELRQSYMKTQKILNDTVDAVATICEKRDAYTAGHQNRVSQLACAIATEMGMTDDAVSCLKIGATVHDVGKLYIPAEILSKPGKLSEVEFALIRSHPVTGYEIISKIEFPDVVAQIVLQHHERLDGSGYPNGLTAKEIVLEAKILAVADVVEAMSSHRPYRPALGIESALEEITKHRGVLYDETVVDTCVRLFNEKQFKFQ